MKMDYELRTMDITYDVETCRGKEIVVIKIKCIQIMIIAMILFDMGNSETPCTEKQALAVNDRHVSVMSYGGYVISVYVLATYRASECICVTIQITASKSITVT